MEITHRTNVVEAGSKLPLSQFRNKPRWMGFFGLLLTEVQLLETAIYESISARYIWNARGWALEQIGKLVGMVRPAYGDAATDDDAYRVLIYGQIAANSSYGTLPDLYNLLGALQCTNVRLFNVYPGAIVVNLIGTELTDTYNTLRPVLVRAAHPVQFDITQHSSTAFGLLGDDNAYGLGVGEIGAAQ